MSDRSPLGSFLKEMGKHDLLTAQEERDLFSEIEDIRAELIHEINRTYVVSNKISTLKDAVKVGSDSLKTYIATYKHERKMAVLKPFLMQNLDEYLSTYIQYQETNNSDLVYSLDLILHEMLFEDSFIQECCYEILGTELENAEDELWVSEETLMDIHTKMQSAVKRFSSLKHKVVDCNLRLVVSQAKTYHNQQGHHTFLDLIQEGSFGLMKAVDRFDYNEGTRFGTLATWWVRQSIIRSLQNDARTVRVPVAVQDHLSKITKFQNAYYEEHNRKPSDREIADELGLSLARVHEIIDSNTSTTSTDTAVGEDGDMTIGDLIPDDAFVSAYQEIDRAETKTQILAAMEYLDDEQKSFINKRFGLEDNPVSIIELAIEYGVTSNEIREIEAEILNDLKEFMQCL